LVRLEWRRAPGADGRDAPGHDGNEGRLDKILSAA
jgi:hypothetical protein